MAGCITYTGIDKDTGELIEVAEWVFQTNNRNDLTCIQKQISNIEQEFTYLLKLKHPNLVLYYGIKYHPDHDCVIVNVLKEFIHGKVHNASKYIHLIIYL